MRAPRDRNSKVRVMAVVIWAVETLKAVFNRETVKETAKKSYPSHVHAHHPLKRVSRNLIQSW